MASSAVDIVNMALSHIGERATVVSIDPPEASYPAEQAAIFYPIARDTALAGWSWSFNTRRAALAQLAEPPLFGWRYAFALPADCLHLLGVYRATALHDFAPLANPNAVSVPAFPPKPVSPTAVEYHVAELDDLGRRIVYADEPGVLARYRARVDNPANFSPEFVQALSWLLAHHLAGSLIKGQDGMAVSRQCLDVYRALADAAAARDANQSRRPMMWLPAHLASRHD